jgi:hypothetical protein
MMFGKTPIGRGGPQAQFPEVNLPEVILCPLL